VAWSGQAQSSVISSPTVIVAYVWLVDLCMDGYSPRFLKNEAKQRER
jgi:hypothetical protein